jgi:T1SS-143 domain-containing protein
MRYEDASHTSAFQGQGPIANDDTDQLAAGSKSSATGNLITGDGTQTGSAGADSATGGHITAIAGKGGEDSSFAGGKLSVMGEYGKLSVDAQGNYVYQANKGVENVRDRFTYTLADNNGATDTASLVVEIGKTPFAVKADAQQVVVGPDGVVTLPAGVELSDVHVVGRNLVVDMPDGTQMIIIDGAVFVPQLVLNGVEVPATNVAALLIGQEVQPAAGETPPSSGGNFAVPPPPLDPGVPLGDLIPPTEYTYKPPEPQPPLDIQDSEPEAGVATALLDDDAQQGGNPLSTTGDDPGGAVATGNLPGSGGDGNLTWELTGGGTVPAGLGFALSPQLNGDLWILQGGVHVITVHVDPTNGDYIVTQIAAIDHTAGGNENNEIFTLNYSVTDQDGDVATGTLTIDVDDDMPTVNVSAGPDADVILTTDDAQTIGAASDTAVTSANFSGVFGGTTVVFGADGAGPGSSSTYALAITGSNSGLASHGAAINLYVVGGVVVGSTAATAGAIDAGNTIFTVSTTNTGVVTLTQFQQIDHVVENPNGPPFADQFASLADGLVTLTRSETAVDGDGDQVTGSATVNIGANLHFTDDGPSVSLSAAAEPTLIVDESNFGGNAGPTSFASLFNFSFGADGPAASGSLQFNLGINPGATGLVDTLTGAAVVLSLESGQVIGRAGAGGPVVLVISVDANGNVSLDQQRAVIHSDPNDPNDDITFASDNLITLSATATDFDGDTGTIATPIAIAQDFHFLDDGPNANNDVDSIVGGSGPATGNVLTGVDSPGGDANATDGVADSSGADSPATVVGLASNNVPANVDNNAAGGFVVVGQYGTLTVNADGSYSYLRTDLSPGSKQDVFTYTMKDADGDTDTATLTINITDNAPIAGTVNATLDDDALANGNPGGVGDDSPDTSNLTGNLPGSGGDGTLTFSVGLGGAPAGFTYVSGGAGVVLIQQGGVTKITVTVNSDGSYTIVQNLPLDHAAGGNENNQSFALTYTVTDADGDPANGTININVDDDTPIATATLLTGTVDEDGVPGGIAGGPDDVAGAATSATGNVSSLFASGADTPLTYQLLGSFAGLPALTSGGVAVTYGVALNAGVYTLTASAGANTVFTFTLNATSGAYNFTLVDQIDHPTLNGLPGDDTENDLLIQLGSIIQATDHDGDTVVANANGLVITVDDDTPTAANDTDQVAAGGSSTTGNVITGAGTTSGAAGQDFPGADSPASIIQISGTGGTDATFSGGVLSIGGSFGTLDMDASGNYTYTRNGGSPGNVQDVFTYTYQDADGDKVTATLTITINDAAPIAGTVNATLDDDALANGNPGGVGDQNPDTSNLTGTLPGSGGDGTLTFGVLLTGAPAGFTYVSGGAGVVLIQQGGVTKITVTVNANGSYTIVQNLPIDHAAGGNENDQAFALTYTVTDADTDQATGTININVDDDTPIATATLLTGTVDEDGVPGGIAGGTGDVAGEPVSATGNVSGLFASGADTPLTYQLLGSFAGLPALTSNGVAVTYGVVLNAGVYTLTASAGANTVFTFTLNATTGAYNFTLVDQLDHAAGLNENDLTIALGSIIQATDHDGDTVVANANGLVITVDDDTPTAAIATTANNVSVDESVGIQADSNDTTNAGVIALFSGVANKGVDTDLPQYATNANAIVTIAGSAVGADAPGSTVFSLNVSSAGVDSGLNTTSGQDILLFKEGSLIVGRVSGGPDDGKAAFAIAIDQTGHISIVEYLSIQHPNAANPDDVLSIADGAVVAVVTVTDADGDSATQNVAIGSHIQFQDSGPVMTAAQNMNIQNSGDVAHTAAFAFNLGADGANTSNDVITNVTGSATVGGVAVQNWTLTPGAETATTASYSFSFDYPIGGGNTAHETGTLVFDKAAGTYTIDLANPIQGVTTILQTATGTLFQGYEFGSSTLDGSQPAISVTQIQDLAGTANDIYVQFTSVAEPSSGTGDNNLEFSNWVPGADNPAPVNGGGDTTWNPGQLFNQTDSWVSTSNDANGVAGDTIQGGEVLDFNLVQGANPTGILADPSTYAQASSMFLKFDGIGSSEDMIVVLKLYDTVAHTYTTVALMVQNSDIQKGPGSGPGIYSGITLDQNDGLIIIEPNDYQQGNTNLVIVGAQIAGSDEGLSGTAIDFNYGGVLGVASTGTQDFSTDVSDGPFKISSIGFTSLSTTPQNAQLDFNVTVTDGDGDSITQAISATVTPAIDSVSAATIPAANTTVAPVLLDLNGDGVQFLAADAGVRYDYNGDGVKEATAWAGPTDGILIHDANGNGTVDGAGEFVFGSGSVTDLQGLRAIYGDTLDANDADFAQFGVWQDANSNGVVDAGEYQSLTAAGIASINLVSDGVTYSAADGDVIVAGSSTYTSTDGSTGAVADASFYVGRSVDDEKALSSSTSNIALAAAIAAAGLAASQPAAASVPDEASHGQTVADTAAGVGPAVVAAADDAAESRSALGNEVREAADDVPQAASSGHSDASADSSHSLDDSQASAPASSDEAAANDDQGPAAATADASPVAPTVAMVSAEALQAAGLDGNVQHGGSVEKIIVEALGHGNGNGAVDALLDAFHGGNGGGAAIANLASAPSGAVSAWDMASNGASAGANEMLMKVGAEMLHHDAVQPTHNG